MLSAVRAKAYSVYYYRRQAQRRVTMRAATPRRRLLLEHFPLEHFPLNQLRQLDATALRTTPCGLATALIVPAWRMSISSQAAAAVSRNVALGASSPSWGHLRPYAASAATGCSAPKPDPHYMA